MSWLLAPFREIMETECNKQYPYSHVHLQTTTATTRENQFGILPIFRGLKTYVNGLLVKQAEVLAPFLDVHRGNIVRQTYGTKSFRQHRLSASSTRRPDRSLSHFVLDYRDGRCDGYVESQVLLSVVEGRKGAPEQASARLLGQSVDAVSLIIRAPFLVEQNPDAAWRHMVGDVR